MYDLCIWKHYSATVFINYRSCYNKCIKMLLVTLDQIAWDADIAVFANG